MSEYVSSQSDVINRTQQSAMSFAQSHLLSVVVKSHQVKVNNDVFFFFCSNGYRTQLKSDIAFALA